MFRYHATSSFPIQATELQPGFQAIQATELRMSSDLTFPLLNQQLLSFNETFLRFGNHKTQLWNWMYMNPKLFDVDGIRTHACRAHWISSPTP